MGILYKGKRMPYKCKFCFQLSQRILLFSIIGNIGVALAIVGQVLVTGGGTCRLPNGDSCFAISVGGLFYGGLLIVFSLLLLFFARREKKGRVLLAWLGLTGLWFILGSGLNYGFVVNGVFMGGWIILRLLSGCRIL